MKTYIAKTENIDIDDISLAEKHQDTFGLDEPLLEDEFNNIEQFKNRKIFTGKYLLINTFGT